MKRATLGFALVSYRDPEQTLDLIHLLCEMFDGPPIAIHHDQRYSRLKLRDCPSNVRLIPETFRTGWGTLATVRAMASCIRHVMEAPERPEWFTLITSHCMPIQPAAQIREFLSASPHDVFIRQSVVYPLENPTPWELEMQERYVKDRIRIPVINRSRRLTYKYKSLGTIPDDCPFSENFPCRSGVTYVTGNHKAAATLERAMENDTLIRWLSRCPIVDECLFATAFGNDPDLSIAPTDLRFIKWLDPSQNPGEPNPKTLTEDDFDELAASGMQFARKLLPGKSDGLRAKIKTELLGLEPSSRSD